MKWYETITSRLRTRMGMPILQTALLAALSLFLSACLIIDVQITENVDAGGTVTLTVVIQENSADVNAWKGVMMVLVPDDWTFASATYSADDINGAVGSGSMVEAARHADSAAVGVYPAPPGMKWIAMESDMAYAHGDTLIMEVTAEFTAGNRNGTYDVGIVVTKESYFPSVGDWFGTMGSAIVGADSSMVNKVTVSGGVSVLRDLLAVPDDVLTELTAAGNGLSVELMDSLLKAHLDFDTEYTIRGVVLTDPLKSGLGTWNNDRGGPSRVHIYIRDPAADTQGNAAMGTPLVDGAYEQNGSLDLIPGDVIEVTGKFSAFTNAVQFSPTTTIVVLGDYTDLGLSNNIIVPDTFTTADFSTGFGDGTYTVNWNNYNELNGSYVCIKDATIFRRTVTGSREDWAVTNDGGETVVTTYDMSLRYRNDRIGAYTAPFDVLEDPFVPPPIGATVDVCGTVVHQPGNDPFGLYIPADGHLSLAPWADSDLVIKASPPAVGSPSTPSSFLTAADSYDVTADVTFDPNRSAAGVTLAYSVNGGDATEMAMVNSEGTTWTGTIPAQAEGAFVTYSVTAEDNTGASTTSSTRGYRVLDADGLNTIAEIQMTADGGPGDSPFRNMTGDMDITATVQSHPSVSGMISIQDDDELSPWSGILLTSSEALVADLANGDVIHITAGTVRENFGVTELNDITYEKVTGKSQDALPYLVLQTDEVIDSANPEAYEGMLLRFEDVLITALENNFGEWRFSNGEPDDYIRGDGNSSSFPDDNSVFTPGERWSFIQGIWWYSFGTYKIVPEDVDADKGEVINVSVDPTGVGVPNQFSLKQNYPNPFNPTTNIGFDVRTAGHVRLDVFDVTGRLVSTLVDETLSAGSYQATFDAANLPSGMYLYRMTAGGQVLTNRMLLVR